ncbi:mannose-specific lectin-like [Aristolochia californica]|uniref:mannose-specific lectin-like n=1 Tax=Aristolochia californica TaxID=171875 RepID=UPI0035D614CD
MASSLSSLLLVTALAAAASVLNLPVGAEDTLFNGEKLLTNEFIENGPYKFIMQGDCNLVLYKKDKVLWASNTKGHGDSCFLLLQNNGNLVVFSGSDVVWASSSSRGSNTYRLVVQTDGNLIIYGGATWSSNTVQKKSNGRLPSVPSMA